MFSPDGKRIAFENPRGGYSTQEPNPWGPTRAYTWGFIAVYDVADGHIANFYVVRNPDKLGRVAIG